MNIGIDHGYFAIKTKHFSFPAGVSAYESEPFTLQNTLELGGKFYVCGTGRQPLQRDKTANDNYWLLTSFGRDKLPFKNYFLRSSQQVMFKYEGEAFEITIEDVKLFPQGYSALALHPDILGGEPSVLLMDIGGWTVDLMRLDNAVPNAATCRSLEMGVIRCIDTALEQVRRDVGLSVTEAQCERVLDGKSCGMDERAKNIIQEHGRLYTERLLSAVMESGFDLKAMPVILLGGGARLVMRNVAPKDRLCRVIPLLDARVNAEGFERLLGQIQSR